MNNLKRGMTTTTDADLMTWSIDFIDPSCWDRFLFVNIHMNIWSKGGKMIFGACPECDGDVPFKKVPRLDQRIICPECGAYLVIIGTSPIELDWGFDDPAEEEEIYLEFEDEGY
jgi:hypothetical protein